ncbi:MAG: hypothetical protein U9P49_12895 [Thermodesulfobacteriota bacterium]|nr:hypothetical protein [Thermodesulfobacteriota bacterium]
MWKIAIKLFGLFVLILLIETTITPYISGFLRIDLFLGLIMGLVIYVPFAYGITATFIFSFLLQAFSGARLGSLPFVYIGVYLGIELVKGFVYPENILVQIALVCVFNVLVVAITGGFMDIWFVEEGLCPLILGTALTGLAAPVMIVTIKQLYQKNES